MRAGYIGAIAARRASSAPPDGPDWDQIAALFHFDETPLIEETGRAGIAANFGGGGAVVSTSIKKFGAGSLACVGNIWNPQRMGPKPGFSMVLGTDPFTISFWLRPNDGDHGSSWGRILQMGNNDTMGGLFVTRLNNTYPLSPVVRVYDGTGYVNVLSDNSKTVPDGDFSHIELSRDEAGVWRLFINGNKAIEATYTGAGNNLTGNFAILGADSGVWTLFKGYYDEFMLLKGAALHTSNFTPPTEPFSGP